MSEIPESLYIQLMTAVHESLSMSEPVKSTLAEINAAGFDIVFALWSREVEAGVDCDFSCNPQLQLFNAEPSALRETGDADFDIRFLRSLGISG